MSIAEIAASEGKDPVDAWLDLSLDEGLETEFSLSGLVGGNAEADVETLTHPLTHPSFSDGGAHVRFFTTSTWPTYLLSHWVRRRGGPYTGAGPLQDECASRLVGRVPG